jgi:hypothetical protein
MHPRGPPFSLNVAATVAEAVGVVDAEDAVDAEDTVDTVDTVEAVEPETATKVSAPIVRAHTPAFGLIGIRVVIIGIRMQTWMRVIVGVDVYVRLSLEI